MNCSAAILSQWRREDPDRLLQAALSQAERLAEMAPELEALRAEKTSLHRQLEVQTNKAHRRAARGARSGPTRCAPPSCSFPHRSPKAGGRAQAARTPARTSRLTTYQATCVRCGQSLRSTHPLQMSLAIGDSDETSWWEDFLSKEECCQEQQSRDPLDL